MKRILVIISFILLGFNVQIAQAGNVALNDTLTHDTFVNAFNQSKDAIDKNVQISKKETNFDNKTNHYITLYLTNQGNVFVGHSDSSGKLRELDIWVDLESDSNGHVIHFEETQKKLILQMLLAERVLGMPSGEAAEDGVFAIIDAMKNGRGTYWSNVTNRRYIVEKISSKKSGSIGFLIYSNI